MGLAGALGEAGEPGLKVHVHLQSQLKLFKFMIFMTSLPSHRGTWVWLDHAEEWEVLVRL